jgi:hypothetical protein
VNEHTIGIDDSRTSLAAAKPHDLYAQKLIFLRHPNHLRL